MKKFTLIIVTAALIAGLTGCNKTENPDSSNDSTSTSIQTNVTESTESEESTDSADSEPLSDDVKRLIEEYPCVLDFKGRDGTVLQPSDITRVEFPTPEAIEADILNTGVIYGFAYMEYGAPVFATTLGNDDWKSDGDGFTDIIEWLHYREDKAKETAANAKCFTVRPGDVLENGLVVKSAEMRYGAILPGKPEEWTDPLAAGIDPFSSSKIEFEGTLTLEGILFRYEGNDQYFSVSDDLFFYPDTTKNEYVPLENRIGSDLLAPPNECVGVVYNCSYFLGNLKETNYDVDDIFTDANYARVRITLDNIFIDISGSAYSVENAELVEVERID